MNLLLFNQAELEGSVLRVNGPRARHLHEVLRITVGDTVRIGQLGGCTGTARILAAGLQEVTLGIETLETASPRPLTDLIVALPRPQIFKRVLFTSAMLGVRRLFVTGSARVEKSYFHSPLLQEGKMAEHILEGLSQARSTIAPEIHVFTGFREFSANIPLYLKEAAAALFAHPEAPRSLAQLELHRRLDAESVVMLAVGPEGGWIPREEERFAGLGFVPFHCGPRIMRVDSVICSLLGQLDLLRSMRVCGE